MNVGALVRTEARGLGVQSQAFVRNMGARALRIEVPNRSAHVCPADWSVLPDAPIAHVGAGWRLDERVVRPWLEGLDFLWTAETFYDDRLPDWCRAAGVVSLIHANPEFVTPDLAGHGLGRPTQWWSATSWRLAHMPAGTEVVPWPVEPAEPVVPHDGPARFLFLGGRTAMRDRNGMDALRAALPLLREPCQVTVCSQEGRSKLAPRPAHVTAFTIGSLPAAELPAVYGVHDVLVMPRRYGGLCLPVGEAMAHGLAVLMPEVPPNIDAWPVATFPALPGAPERMPAGMVDVAEFDPAVLAAAMDRFADPEYRAGWQAESRWWSSENSWELAATRWLERMAALRALAA